MHCTRPQPALAENPQNSGAMTSTEGDKQLIDPATDADLQSKPRQKTSSGLEYQEVVAGKGPSPSVGIQVHSTGCWLSWRRGIVVASLMRQECFARKCFCQLYCSRWRHAACVALWPQVLMPTYTLPRWS